MIPIPGTLRAVWPGAQPAGEVGSGDVLLTAWLRPRDAAALDAARASRIATLPPARRAYVDRGELEKSTGADPADVEAVIGYCTNLGIEVVATHWRSIVLRAPADRLVEAFGATAGIYELPDKRRFRHRSGELHAHPEIAAILRGPFGIHQWPRSHAIGTIQPHTLPLPMSDIVQRYAFPDGDGSGETIGVLALRGTFKSDDFIKGMQAQGVSAKMPIVKRIDDAELTHDIVTEKDVEAAMDTQIVGALAPGAQIVLYTAPDDERGVLDAIRTAIFDAENAPSILSISFGYPERVWTPIALTILDELFTAAALIGVSVFCASGDNGAELDAAGDPQVLAPASCTFVHACGGTDATTGSELAWSRGGGGFSERFEVPPWQTAIGALAAASGRKPGRGVPDFSAEAMPGYSAYFDGMQLAMGGTSAVAPLWAALTARLNQRLGKAAGFFAPLLYAAPAALRDIVTGGNDRYRSGAGWDACTGLGVPIGDAIERALQL